MNDRMQTKVLVLTGIMALNLFLPITPLSYAAGSANSPDVISKDLKSNKSDQKKTEEKSGNNVPMQRNDGKEDQDDVAGPLQDFHSDIDRLFDRTFRDFGFPPFDMDRPFRHTGGGMFKPVLLQICLQAIRNTPSPSRSPVRRKMISGSKSLIMS